MARLTVTFFVLALIAGVVSLMNGIEPTAARLAQNAALGCIGLFMLSLLLVQARNKHH